MTTRSFLANFFRQGTSESSTRLVGILSFFAAVGLAFYMVIVGKTGAGDVTVLGLTFANACIALGLRKSPDAEGGSPS
jgi:hypothetical protein